MAENCKIIVSLNNGWEGEELVTYNSKEDFFVYELKEKHASFTFDVPDRYQWIHSTDIVDGWSFSVACEYVNSSGSRKQTYQLVPQKLCDTQIK